ncbi:MAG: glutamate--cysteine ligase [Proteobacteria bacterium]|nr:glutamate--cysteine ligase [Pseudomonadota bacterium]
MGIDIDKVDFAPADFVAFGARLEQNLNALAEALATPGFGVGPASLGAELEMYIVDAAGNPLYVNEDILSDAKDPQLTLELNRYNLEFNLSPHALSDSPFVQTEREICNKLQSLKMVAARHGGRIVPIGILPTLTQADFGSHCITDRKRYHALVAQLIKRRGNEFQIDINGEDPLKLQMEDITLEGANTSFQVHYRVDPEHYADSFNAIQLMTPLAVAIGANSPTLFGHSLWHETRIPLFKQSIDTRHTDRYSCNEPARVNFGHGWVRRGAEELFTETVRLYPPLLPICSPPEPGLDGLGAPSLAELRMHQSTVWLWNRPVYDQADGGHLRIEMRALPAGPSAIDMVANAAFLIGLSEGIRPRINDLLPALPFHMAEYNFYRAAQRGLGARLIWPQLDQSGCAERSVSAIIEELLPCAQQGLARLGISSEESGRYLSVIETRLQRQQTGAIWQQKRLAQLKGKMPLDRALHHMLEDFISNSECNVPVAEWSL